MKMRVKVLVTWSCQILCDPMDCSPPGSSVHGIFQARILLRVAISFSRGPSRPRDRTQVSGVAGNSLQSEPPSEKVKVKVAQSCLTLCDPMDCSRPGFSVHGIFQARILEWVAIPFLKRSYQPRDQTQVFFTS